MVFSLYHHVNLTLYYGMTGRHQLRFSRYNVLRSRPYLVPFSLPQ